MKSLVNGAPGGRRRGCSKATSALGSALTPRDLSSDCGPNKMMRSSWASSGWNSNWLTTKTPDHRLTSSSNANAVIYHLSCSSGSVGCRKVTAPPCVPGIHCSSCRWQICQLDCSQCSSLSGCSSHCRTACTWMVTALGKIALTVLFGNDWQWEVFSTAAWLPNPRGQHTATVNCPSASFAVAGDYCWEVLQRSSIFVALQGAEEKFWSFGQPCASGTSDLADAARNCKWVCT